MSSQNQNIPGGKAKGEPTTWVFPWNITQPGTIGHSSTTARVQPGTINPLELEEDHPAPIKHKRTPSEEARHEAHVACPEYRKGIKKVLRDSYLPTTKDTAAERSLKKVFNKDLVRREGVDVPTKEERERAVYCRGRVEGVEVEEGDF